MNNLTKRTLNLTKEEQLILQVAIEKYCASYFEATIGRMTDEHVDYRKEAAHIKLAMNLINKLHLIP